MEVNYFTILYWFCHTSTWIRHGCTRALHPEPPSHLPPHTIPKHPVSCIEPGLAIRFFYDISFHKQWCDGHLPLIPWGSVHCSTAHDSPKTREQAECPRTHDWIQVWRLHTVDTTQPQKEWNNTTCSNTDGPRDYHTKSERKRHMMSLICGI